jgi:CelD/BcsL family acetyltransferase involved in cellulose biosynthesis
LKLDRRCDVVHRTQRALLKTSLSPDDYWRTADRATKRKDIRRLERRLEEIGETRFSRLGEQEDPDPWIEAFLALELGGWKGQAGSALASDPATAELFRTAVRSAHDLRKLDFCRLDLDGEPLAMLVNFLAPPGAYGFKTAFDERYSRYSPGVILQRYNLNILSRPDIDWVDSCAAENHPMIDSLWSDKRSIIRASVSLSGRTNRMIFRIGRSIEKLATLLRLLRSRGSNQDV